MEKISVILPVASTKQKDFVEFFTKSINSIIQQESPIDELVLVHTDDTMLCTFLDEFDFSGLTLNKVLNKGDSDFASQVNLGVKSSTNEFVSILEFDDEYSKIWFKNVQKYITSYPTVEAFLSLVVDVDDKGVFAGFTNEATFAANMNTNIGYLTNEVLMNYQNFQTSGMVFKKSLFEKYGGFKKNIKLSFVYELLLRLTYNSVEMITIPRIGYKHMNMREGSIFWNYRNGSQSLSPDEARFWLETAKKEHFFTEDRQIKYEVEVD